MIGYPYIQELFQSILNKSKIIQGRFYVCPNWGAEMSNPNISDALPIGAEKSQKYPAALLMPPPKEGNFEYLGDQNVTGNSLYDLYSIQILFVGNATNTGQNQVTKQNGAGMSTHTVPQMWHDMDRVAQNFCSVLRQKIEQTGGTILFWDDFKPKITLITNIGNDIVTGVKLVFKLGVFSGCQIEDYPDDYKESIVIPSLVDSHPLHTDI